jgi:preprotein translocase subunit SecD
VGNDQLEAGLIAGGIGLLLVMLYLLFYYRILGIVAGLSLVVAGGLLYAIFVVLSKSIGLTLTLAGVAGAIVAIGITADSFIVYFERIRDEIRDGKSLRQACD